ncbi:hypothetical protein [Mycolicibacterium poriferae]|nr:hypothetical protein [Mycolicibacterium poriferae]MCV7262654.1 hypothetical protein [Mycolicibacterium poriferae]
MSGRLDGAWMSSAVGGGHNSVVVSTTGIRASDLTDEHVGRTLGFHDHATRLNVPGEILRIQHSDGPPPTVSIWLRYPAMPDGSGPRDDFMQTAPWFELQLVETKF